MILFVPFFLQGALIATDEIYCHRRRGLSQLEKLSHVVDSSLLLITFVFALYVNPTANSEIQFFVLSAISTVAITKDEWIHARESDGLEQWLHAWLFIVHPLVLVSLWQVWHQSGRRDYLLGAAAAIGAFCFTQTIGWIRGFRANPT